MKRYPKYKDSGIQWLGQIPEHWETRKIAELFTERREKVSDKDFPALSVSKAGITPQLETAVKTDNGDNRKKVCEGDFVVNSRSDRKGSCGVSPYTGSVSLINTVLQPRTELNRSYMHYLLRSNDYIEEYYRLGRGIVADLWTTRYSEAKNIYIPFPPIAEQEKIVAFIDAKTNQIDAFIAEREKQSQALSELRQTIIAEAVTRGLNPDVPMKDSGVAFIGLIPAHWTVEPFGRHFTYSKGLPITKADLRPEGVAVISYGQVHSKQNTGLTMSENLVRRVSEDYLQTHPQCLLQTSDFVFADTSEDIEGAGNFAYNDYADSIFAGYHTLVARPIDLPYPKYYACLFRSSQWKSQVGSLVNGVKVFSITRGILKKSYILMPPIEEQRAIVEYIDSKCKHINDTIAQIESEITHLKEYKQRLIADAVTGAINVQE